MRSGSRWANGKKKVGRSPPASFIRSRRSPRRRPDTSVRSFEDGEGVMLYRPVAPAPRTSRGAFHFEPLESRRLLSAYGVIDLGTLGGGTSWANDLNNNGQVVGYSTNAAGRDRAFLFSDTNANGVADPGEMVDL